MKRILATISLLISLYSIAWANREVPIQLDPKDKRVYSEPLGFGYITFEYLYCSGNNARVRAYVENITQNPPLAILIFRRDMDEQSLKRNKPKVKFEKKFPGEKGNRIVHGCPEGYNYYSIITPAETDTIFTIDVSLTSPKKLIVPFYVAKYKPKDLTKKGENNISYKILEEHIFDFNIEVEGWTEEDATYVKTKQTVDSLLASLNGVEFCNNKRHIPSLKVQQKKYQAAKDNLISEITNILENNRDWLSHDEPYIAYNKLLLQLQSVNLDSYVSDCGKHKIKPTHKGCNFCNLTAQQIYHRLDDIYQQLYSGKISKNNAVNTANALYECYQNHRTRKKNSSYGNKISSFYNRITNY